MNSALLSSKKMDWCTPQDFFDALNEEFAFVLDAAATEKTKKCSACYTPETDGLSQTWNVGGAVFCNPPYGREIGKWVEKAYKEAAGGATIVLLIPARTDTSYFHEFIYGKAEIRFVRGRLKFTDDDGNASDPAPFPSMLVIYNGKAVNDANSPPTITAFAKNAPRGSGRERSKVATTEITTKIRRCDICGKEVPSYANVCEATPVTYLLTQDVYYGGRKEYIEICDECNGEIAKCVAGLLKKRNQNG